MRKSKFIDIREKGLLRLVLIVMASMAAWSMMSLSPFASGPERVDIVDLPGVTGASNNVAFAFDRYVLVAPYAPSNSDDVDASDDADNHFLHLIDTKKPNAKPKAIDLTTAEAPDGSKKRLFYPTKLVFDPETSIAYIRGTRYEQREDGAAEIEALAYVHLSLVEGKPDFDTVRMIDIKGIGADETREAPMDFAIGRDGKFVAFTNGATIFTYNVDDGYLNKAEIVPPNEYGNDSAVTYLDIDRASNTLTVCWNKKIKSGSDEWRMSSELSFYKLIEDGSLKFLKRVYPERFPIDAYLTAGSNVAVNSDGGVATSAYFMTSDGTLCQVELDSEGVPDDTAAKPLQSFPELAQKNGKEASARLVKYDQSKRLIGVVEQGFRAQIKRPSNGKPGKRNLFAYTTVEEPALALVKLGKKNKVVSAGVFREKFAKEGGLSNFVNGDDNNLLIATYSGKLFSVALEDSVGNSRVSELGQIGSRIERIDYYANRPSVVAINSMEPDEEGNEIIEPGSLIIARFSGAAIQGAASVSPFTANLAVAGGPTPSIRRPCNIKK